jgi:phosphate transport system permease protein
LPATPPATTSPATASAPSAAPARITTEFAARHARHTRLRALLLRILVYLGAAATITALLFIVCYILVMGIPNISWDLFALPYTPFNVSLMPALINTLLMAALALGLAVPLGIGAAIYLVEYTGRGNKLVGIVRITAETLTGIPSIVYGLFGLLFFVTALGWRISLLAGAFTLAIMILPIIMRTTEEALKAVPDTYREGSFGLGSGRLRTVFRILLPSAIPGILAGVILGIGRIVGESAALIYTAGTVAEIPASAFDSTRTLSVHMYVLASEGLHIDKTYATAVILLVIVLLINTLSAVVARRLTRGKTDD